jgi:hypothetical protein
MQESGPEQSFISQYLDYVGNTECPMFYHRWCCLSMVGTYLGRQYTFKLGHTVLYPNKYVMLIGTPGTRKSTAIKIAKSILAGTGYDKFSGDKSSKEKFMMDLAGEEFDGEPNNSDILERNLWGDAGAAPAEMYIACDEFNDFIGNNNIEFISLLGNLWDYNGVFKNRIKTGKSVSITDPTISILGGNTPVSFARAFPPDVLGQGFFSRLLLVQGDPTGKKITFPEPPSPVATGKIIEALQRIKSTIAGEAVLTPEAKQLLDKIYKTWQSIDDMRFEHYSTRRFTHLLKLCLVISACHYSTEITAAHVVEANTVLTHTESLMPKALGEFGKSRNSDVTHKIMSILNVSFTPVPLKDLWAAVHTDIEKVGDLAEIMRSLALAGKITTVSGGFLPRKKVQEEEVSDSLDYDYLTREERNMAK